jgi:hypothetical protein
VFAAMDNLLEKPKVVLLLYVVAISLGLLMVADSVVPGRIIGWVQPAEVQPHGCRAKFLRPAYDAWTFAN